MAFQRHARHCLDWMELSMGIALWTATAFVRPLHALQRWWQGPGSTPPACAHAVPGSHFGNPHAPAPVRQCAGNLPASPAAGEDGCTPTTTVPQSFCSALEPVIPVRYRLPCNLTTPAPLPKTPRSSPCASAAKNRESSRSARPLHGSVPTPEAGHFFLAGRMADVCAELDRLAAHEAAH